ncbi:MAG: GNAT family N-acetyltransferase [Nibricoccus sp.]
MDKEVIACPPVPAGLAIRPAVHEDTGTIAALVRELAAFEHLDHECAITPAAVREHLLGLNRSAEAVIAELDGLVAGFAVYYRTFSTFAARPGVFLEDLFVRPAFRHRGLGRALLQYVGSIAARNGAGRFEWTTLKWNENARRLYKSIGAEEKREWLLLRMEAEALSKFVCYGTGEPKENCRCGGKGIHHTQAEPARHGHCGCGGAGH